MEMKRENAEREEKGGAGQGKQVARRLREESRHKHSAILHVIRTVNETAPGGFWRSNQAADESV